MMTDDSLAFFEEFIAISI